MTISEIYTAFPERKDCLDFIQRAFHGKSMSCPKCKDAERQIQMPEKYQCRSCRCQYTALTNTIFHGAKGELQKWFLIVMLITSESGDKSISYISEKTGLERKNVKSTIEKIKLIGKGISILSRAIFNNDPEIAQGKLKMADPGLDKKQNKTKVIDSKRNTKKPKIAATIPLAATHSGVFQILGKDIPCAVLKDGSRIIIQKSVFDAFERPARGARSSDRKILMPSFLAANNLLPYITEDAKKILDPVFYTDKDGNLKKGYKAEILPVMCDIYLSARKDKTLTAGQKRIGDLSEMIVRGLAKVGIVALVDEATGYQNVRENNALSALLDKYLNKELASWAKKFPDEFYKEMFRLKKWDWSFKKRPKCVGKLTNDIVYERIAPELVKELESRNPKDEMGRRAGAHHQLLTVDLGHPSLSQHLHAIIGLMRISTDWEQFYNFLQVSFPKKTTNSIDSLLTIA